jgi:hypothetical protein
MAKPTDRVQIQKRESAAGGGDAADDSPFLYDPLDSSEDCVELRGVFLQDAGGLKDEDVGIWRDGDDIVFLDVTTGTESTLTNLLANTSDHGDLTGKDDDDHTQYLLVAGTRASTGVQTFSAGISIGGNTGSDILIGSDGVSTSNLALTTAGYVDANYLRDTDAYSHPNHSGDVTSVGDGAQTIVANAVTNTKAADMAANTVKVNPTTGAADPSDLAMASSTMLARLAAGNIVAATPTQIRTLLNVADGSNNYVHPNHTGDVTSTGDGATVIANAAVTNAKMANMVATTFKGRALGAGTGAPTDLTATQATAMLNNFSSTLKGLAPLSGGGTTNFLRADGTWATPPDTDTIYTHPNHTGDVTSTGDGATVIAANAVTNTKAADMAANTVKVNPTTGTADPSDLAMGSSTVLARLAAGNIVAATPAQIRTLINVADGSNNYSHPNHTGDVTSVGDGAQTIANSAVTNAKMANMVQSTFKGRAVSAGTGAPVDLTATQATAILNNFSSTLKGLVPLSGGGTTNFLRADGTWAAPPAGTTLDGAYDFGGSGAGRVITVDNGPIEATNNSVGTGSTPAILLVNNTSATNGVQKYSPILELEGQGYSTGFVASQEVKFAIQTKPIQQTLNPTGKLSFQKSVNGDAYSEIATLDTIGSLDLGGNLSAGGGVFSGTLTAQNTSNFTGVATFSNNVVMNGDDKHGDRIAIFAAGGGLWMTTAGAWYDGLESSAGSDWAGRVIATGIGNILAIPITLRVGDRIKAITFRYYGASGATKRFSFIYCSTASSTPVVHYTTTSTLSSYQPLVANIVDYSVIATRVIWAQMRTGAANDRFYSIEVTYDRP